MQMEYAYLLKNKTLEMPSGNRVVRMHTVTRSSGWIQSQVVDHVTPGHVNQGKILCQVTVSFEVSSPRWQRFS